MMTGRQQGQLYLHRVWASISPQATLPVYLSLLCQRQAQTGLQWLGLGQAGAQSQELNARLPR